MVPARAPSGVCPRTFEALTRTNVVMKAGTMKIERNHGLEKNMLGPNLSFRKCASSEYASREYGEFLQRKLVNVTELRQLLPSFVVAETGLEQCRLSRSIHSTLLPLPRQRV